MQLLRVICEWHIYLEADFQEDEMQLKSFLACLVAGSLASVVANAAPKCPKRLHAAGSGAAVMRSAAQNPCADPTAVCWAGTYVGRDPDPRVRMQLLWDFQSGLSND
jgi:hypothetical protein